jgi:hypothetical protein
MDEDQWSELSATLDTIKRLLAHQVAQAHETIESKATTLSALGLTPKEIASVCRTTPNTVSVRLAAAKRKGLGRRRAKYGKRGK